MKRIPEPELMDESEQAKAYANADFEEPHSKIIKLLDIEFPGVEIKGPILDLGCGPGDITFRLAYHFSEAEVIGVDGSSEMIKLAQERKSTEGKAASRTRFIKALIPHDAIPGAPYELIISTSFLHHLHTPLVLWESIIRYSGPGTIIFVVDLFRPHSREEAKRIVEKYSGNEPPILKKDYYNSLLAAFEPGEIEDQLFSAGLSDLSVRVISDRHIMIFGERA